MSEVLPWEKIPHAHQMMWKNEHKPGNMAVLVNAPRPGLKSFEDVVEASGAETIPRAAAVGSLAARASAGSRR